MTSFTWRAYLRLACELADSTDEAARRTAISRAYYACFGEAGQYARRNGYSRSGTQHDPLWEWFKEQEDGTGIKINELGKRIKNHRTKADYHADDPVANSSELVLGWAEQLSTLIASLNR